jgi:hypothetical protein
MHDDPQPLAQSSGSRIWLPLPDKLPKGHVLVHNHIKHTVDMPDGLNGFRCWTQDMDNKEELIRCGCGWRSVEHYRVRALGDDKSYTWEELMRAAYDGGDD